MFIAVFCCHIFCLFSNMQLFEIPCSSSLQETDIIVLKGPRVEEEGGNKT